jgi:hypothetical protein
LPVVLLPCSLLDLNPSFIDREHDGRRGLGIRFDCPHCGCDVKLFFRNPIDGGPSKGSEPRWTRVGESYGDLTFDRSVKFEGHFHAGLNKGRWEPC